MLTVVNIFSIGGNMSNQIYIEIENVKKKIEESLKRYGEYSTELIELYEEIADLYCSLNEFEECRYYLLKVLNIKKHFYGETNIALIKTYDQLATVADEKEEIIYYFSEVIRIKELMYGTKHIETANTYVELANVYVYLAEYDKAEKYYLIALEIYSSKEDCGRKEVGCYNELASIYWEIEKLEESVFYAKKAFEKSKEIYGENHHDTACHALSVAIMYDEMNMIDESLEYFEIAVKLFETLYGEEGEDTIFARKEMQKTLNRK